MPDTDRDRAVLVALPQSAPTGRRYDAATIEHAYQLWAWVHGRNAAAVARALSPAPEVRPGEDRVADDADRVHRDTVSRWAKDGRWAERADQEIKQLAPGIHAANVASLIQGSVEAIAALRAVQRGEVEPKMAAVMVKAASEVLSRSGYPATERFIGPEQPAATPLAGLSPDQVASHHQALVDKHRRAANGTPLHDA